MNTLPHIRYRGAGLIEVLVTLVILMVGLLGLVRLQGVATVAQTEAYQRSQAIVLLKDMAERINANRQDALSYVTASPRGTDNIVENCSALIGKDLDLCEWNNALLGTAEKKSSNSNSVGAMLGARGCIYNLDATEPRKFLIAIAWQGLHETAANAAVDCGTGEYGANDGLRRLVTLTLTVAKLD